MSAKTTYEITSKHKRGNAKCQLQDICLWTLGSNQDEDGLPRWQRIHEPMQETQTTQVQSLDGEDPLEEEMATHSSIPAWKIPRTEDPGGLQSMGSQRAGRD